MMGGRGRGWKYSNAKRVWTDRVCGYAHRTGILPYTKPVWFDIRYLEKNRRRDPDNFAAAKKFIFDGLVKARVIRDDGWDEIAGWTERWSVDKSNPGVLIEMTDELP